MAIRYVIDTVGFINYFNSFFEESDILSKETRKNIERCLDASYNHYKLIIPSVVFIEVFKKFLRTEEMSRKFHYEIYSKLKDSEDIEIKDIEKEVLAIFSNLDADYDLELHDKLIFASAIQLDCPLITNDPKIIKVNSRIKYVPEIIF